ncbi:MAG: nucleoside deaminase [Pseudomonadota bacterium]|nr:nucleoside deaminase [Pseudomonadota bacterium]
MVQDHMKFAIDLAERAKKINEVPVGCVISDRYDNLISYAFNSTIKSHDPTGHAEIIAIRKACKKLQTNKLLDFSIYITLEPCNMCEAAIISVGIKKIFFGAYSNNFNIYKKKLSNYYSGNKDYQFFGGFEEERCSKLLLEFFKKMR